MTTQISDFDEGVLILEPFFWSNVIFKICFYCIKSHDWGNEEFLWVPSPALSSTAELRRMLLFYKVRTVSTLPGGAKQWIFLVRQLWLLRQKWQILNTWHCLRKTAIESKTPWCHLVGKSILYAIMDTACLFCPLFSWKEFIVSACILFFSGPPCIVHICQ